MLMAQITETFDDFLHRVTRRLVERLVREQDESIAPDTEDGEWGELLARIQMAARMRKALDEHIAVMVVHASYQRQELLWDTVIDTVSPGSVHRPTWKQIGDALGTSAQAAHRKYGDAVRG